MPSLPWDRRALAGLVCTLIAFAIPTPAGPLQPTNAALEVTGSLPKVVDLSAGNTTLGRRNPMLSVARPMPVDPAGLLDAISAYRSGDLARGDAAAASTPNEVARVAAEWSVLRLQPRLAGSDRIMKFVTTHPDWAGQKALRSRAEESMFAEHRDAAAALTFYADQSPQTVLGRLTLARAMLATGDRTTSSKLIREVWRSGDIPPALESSIHREFSDAIGAADDKYLSDRVFYREGSAASLRIATLAGPDLVAFVKARETLADKQIAALGNGWRNDPSILFAQAQKLRKERKYEDAALILESAPRDPASLVAPDDWWAERRLIGRKLIDSGHPAAAYRVFADQISGSAETRLDAQFHLGWTALRLMNDPQRASAHFEACARIAATPVSMARAAYWQGRAAEANGDADAGRMYFSAASRHSGTYYGQLALTRLGQPNVHMRTPDGAATGDARHLEIRVVELLLALGQRDLALPLAADSARSLRSADQISALAAVVAGSGDARATLTVGKLASARGFAVDETAFPIFGIPPFSPLTGSAPLQVVYAIARQESAFEQHAQSSAGARGLMQMMVATARQTAERAGLPFAEDRLMDDAGFNAQLGAAHLGDLLDLERGSAVLAFAAYNAGAARVKEWIAAYGDPRDPNVDPVDWVEHIPFNETRNYVQRVIEGLTIYRVRLGQTGPLDMDHLLRGPMPDSERNLGFAKQPG